MTGTGLVVPVTTKLSVTHRCSVASGCAMENASKSNLKQKKEGTAERDLLNAFIYFLLDSLTLALLVATFIIVMILVMCASAVKQFFRRRTFEKKKKSITLNLFFSVVIEM